MALLRIAARHGRWFLVLGLIAGLAFPAAALVLKEWLRSLIALLLFLAAFRIGPSAALGSIGAAGQSVLTVFILQVTIPLVFLAAVALTGWQAAPLALAILLTLAAPSLTGSPNLTILLGHNPAAAMRLTLIGTALFPLTAIPILMFAPVLGTPGQVFFATFSSFSIIALAVGTAFAARMVFKPDLTKETREAIDGASAIVLSIVVVGLMSAVAPALEHEPSRLVLWLVAAFMVSFGMQIGTLVLGRPWIAPQDLVATCIVAGNRNVALFLLALPASVTDQFLLFVGCWQFPMYLTPVLLRRIYPPGMSI